MVFVWFVSGKMLGDLPFPLPAEQRESGVLDYGEPIGTIIL